MTAAAPLTVLALVCTLEPSPEPSSADRMARLVLERFPGASTDVVRLVDHDVKPGILDDMGDGDAWPSLRAKVDAADVLVIAGPIWNGQPASPFLRIPERLDAVLGQKTTGSAPRCSARSPCSAWSATRTVRGTSSRS